MIDTARTSIIQLYSCDDQSHGRGSKVEGVERHIHVVFVVLEKKWLLEG
jgi:hypothetical protein